MEWLWGRHSAIQFEIGLFDVRVTGDWIHGTC